MSMYVCMYVCVCVCVFESERESMCGWMGRSTGYRKNHPCEFAQSSLVSSEDLLTVPLIVAPDVMRFCWLIAVETPIGGNSSDERGRSESSYSPASSARKFSRSARSHCDCMPQ